jgi:endoglucanase
MRYLRILGLGIGLVSGIPGRAQDRAAALLERLSNAPGPPGFEEPVRKLMVDEMKPLASSVSFDGMGSIVAS